MNKETGAIARFETVEDARRAGHKLPLTDEQADQLLPLERQSRISAAKHITIEARRDRKAKRKAQRAARRGNR